MTKSVKEVKSTSFYGTKRMSVAGGISKGKRRYMNPVERKALRNCAIWDHKLQRLPLALVDNSLPRPSASSLDNNQQKLFPIFDVKPSHKSPSPQSKSLNLKPHDFATVSPEAVHISLPGTSKTRQSSLLQESPKIKQMVIDAGQKKFGAIQCNDCGMVYTISHPGDQQQHCIYHKRFLTCVKFPGWKKERVISSFVDGRVLKILSSDPVYVTKKANEICSLIDIDLGFNGIRQTYSSLPSVIYLFISNVNQVAGCLVAECITEAYRILPVKEKKDKSLSVVPTCSLEPEEVTCGVSRIWTYYPFRRRGIATRLMNALRSTFVLGSNLQVNQIAFSDPTPDGFSFASNYCKTDEFLTYNLSVQN